MAEKKRVSIKHLQMDKNQTSILAVIAAATFIVIFGLFATKAIVVKGLYQRRALHARRQVVDQLKTNLASANTLFKQYKVFAAQDTNVLGGSATGTGPLDGDNPRIVLDALPSKYDAPALGTSVEKILTSQNINIDSLNITDDPAGNSDQPQPDPKEQTITFTLAGNTTYPGASVLLQTFERSIRPFDITTLEISGTDTSLHLSATVNTYYQPPKSLDLSPTKEVK